jgi:hypothetical protein
MPKTRWKEVLSIASASLRYRNGRYHYRPTLSPRLQEQQRRERDIQKAIAELVRLQKQSTRTGERRRQDRVDFIQPVRIRTEGGRELTLLSRDLSKAGIRIIAAESLLGQKLLVSIPCPEGGQHITFRVRILWTCSIGDGLFENGGSFLELVSNEDPAA